MLRLIAHETLPTIRPLAALYGRKESVFIGGASRMRILVDDPAKEDILPGMGERDTSMDARRRFLIHVADDPLGIHERTHGSALIHSGGQSARGLAAFHDVCFGLEVSLVAYIQPFAP